MKMTRQLGWGILLGSALSVGAADVVWTGTGSWLDPTAWSSGALPASSNSVDIAAGSVVTFAGAAADEFKVGAVNLAATGDSALATLNLESGKFTPGELQIASVSNAVGKLVQNGGELRIPGMGREPSFGIGRAAGGTGTFELAGGSVQVTGNVNIGNQGNGLMLQSGGTFSNSIWVVLGREKGGSGRYEVSAGTVHSNAGLIVGELGTGHAVIGGTGTVTMNRLGINGNSELELLPGGTLGFNYAEKQTNGTGTDGRLTLDGGKIVYQGGAAVQDNFITANLDHVYVKDRGVTFEVPANATVSVRKPLAAHPEATAGEVVKTGAGILRLVEENTFKGKLKVEEGTVMLANAKTLPGYGDENLEVSPGAAVGVSGAMAAADREAVAARVASIANAGYGIDTSSGDLTVSDPIVLNGTGSFVKTGANTLTLTGANSWGGETRIVEGTLAAQRGVGLPTASPLCFAGNSVWAPLADAVLDWGTGAGQLHVLEGATKWGFAALADDVSLTSASPITLGTGYTQPGTLVLSAAPSTRLTLNSELQLETNPTIETPLTGKAVVTGKVVPSGAARTLVKSGPGTLVLKGDLEANASAQRTTLNLNGGSLDLQGVKAEIGALNSEKGGALYLTNQTAVTATGLMRIANSGEGRVVQNGGSLTLTATGGEHYLASAAGTRATYDMNGGALSVAVTSLQIGMLGNGSFLQTDGEVSCNGWVGIARNNSATGLLDVSGGTFTQAGTGNYLSLCHAGGGNATLMVRDQGVVSANRVGLAYDYSATGSAKVIVKDGGRLETGDFLVYNRKGALGERTVTVDGGTLAAKQNQNCFMSMEPVIDVGAGGLTFDTANYTVGFAAQDFAAVAGTMQITKRGSGTMRIMGGIPDATELRVEAGKVELPKAGTGRGLIHRWSFNGNFTDSVGNLTATSVGTTSFRNNQVHLNAGAWNASGVRLGANVLPNDRPVTLEMWATLNASASWNMLLDFGTSTSSHFAIVWRDTSATGNMSVILDGGGTTVATYGTKAADYLEKPVNGTKYHFAFKFIPDGAGGTRIIIRQTNAATGQLVAMWQKLISNWTLAKVTQSNCWLGTSHHKNAIGDSDYDEVRVWGRALTPAELAASVAAGPDAIPDFAFLEQGEEGSALVVAEGATVDLATSTLKVKRLAGAGAVVNGTLVSGEMLSPGGDAVGTLRVEGDLVIKGTLRLNCGDRIECTGNLDLTEAQVQLVNRAQWGGSSTHVFATVEGDIVRGTKIPCLGADGYSVCTGNHTAYVYASGMMIFVR